MASAARGKEGSARPLFSHSDVAAPSGGGAPPTLARRHRAPLRLGTALPGFPYFFCDFSKINSVAVLG